MDTQIKLQQFEGPLDLLLFLVQKNEMDINDLNLSQITKQYLRMIELLRETNMDLMSDFLLMASILVKLKSDQLLPSDEDEEGEETFDQIRTQEELQRKLQEYQKFKEISRVLGDIPKLGHEVFCRPVDPPEVIRERVLAPIGMESFVEAFTEVLGRSVQKAIRVKTDRVTIKDKVKTLKDILKVNETVEFKDLIKHEVSDDAFNDDIVVTFITLLELSRLKKCSVEQVQALGPIYVTLKDNIDDFDLTMVTGFDINLDDSDDIDEAANSPVSSNMVH